jgi:predicted nucleic acid-binding protein
VILVDTNILIDLATRDPIWLDWSREQLIAAVAEDDLVINEVVYAELSIGYASIEELERALDAIPVIVESIPRAALFLAGRAFQRYRAAGGSRSGVLPDFFIGAHALVVGARLLTRDVRRYRAYFPDLLLIAPTRN